jgi:tripartite-type tricarboxylate transporter receptor subunit TctC
VISEEKIMLFSGRPRLSASQTRALSRRTILAAPLVLKGIGAASAQNLSGRSIKLVVPFGAGSEPDILARRLGAAMQELLAQPVVVDNRPGANTAIASNHVSQSLPDGETLLLTSSTTFATLPNLYADPQVRIEQFMPMTMIMRAHMVLYCSTAVPANTVAEFIQYAKAQPEPILYGANLGAIGHLCGEMMKQKVGIQMTDVPYRSSIMLQQMLLRNDVQTGFDGVPAHAGLVADGKLRALGVTGDQHIPLLPGTPTLAEAGYPDIAIPYWYGLFAPQGTPQPVFERIVDAVHKTQAVGSIGKQFKPQGAQIEGNSPVDFATMIASERETWGALIRSIGLKLG